MGAVTTSLRGRPKDCQASFYRNSSRKLKPSIRGLPNLVITEGRANDAEVHEKAQALSATVCVAVRRKEPTGSIWNFACSTDSRSQHLRKCELDDWSSSPQHVKWANDRVETGGT